MILNLADLRLSRDGAARKLPVLLFGTGSLDGRGRPDGLGLVDWSMFVELFVELFARTRGYTNGHCPSSRGWIDGQLMISVAVKDRKQELLLIKDGTWKNGGRSSVIQRLRNQVRSNGALKIYREGTLPIVRNILTNLQPQNT